MICFDMAKRLANVQTVFPKRTKKCKCYFMFNQHNALLDSSATTPKRNKSQNHSSLLDSPTLKMPQSPISPISTPHNRKRRRDSDQDELTQKSKRDRKYSPLTWMMRKNTVVDHDMMSLVIWANANLSFVTKEVFQISNIKTMLC